MGKVFWIRLALKLFCKWLQKRQEENLDGDNLTQVDNWLIRVTNAGGEDSLINIITDESTEEVIEQIVDDIAKEPCSAILEWVFKGVFEGNKGTE